LEFYQLGFTKHGDSHGRWTCLSLKAKKGDMCDDSSGKPFTSTPVWKEAPAFRKLLEPIEGALRRVRFSIMHPATMVGWHCDDCAAEFRGQQTQQTCDQKLLKRKGRHGPDPDKLHKFHSYVRLHLMLSNSDVKSSFGGQESHGTESGGFYLANIAMPHRVDNTGSTSRTALLVDVTIKGAEKILGASALGRSILEATKTLKAADAGATYLQMGYAMDKYRCGLSTAERYETEWHSQAWSKAFWRPPLPPFRDELFNSKGRCGVLGPRKNKRKMEALMLGQLPSPPSGIANRRRRRRSRKAAAKQQ